MDDNMRSKARALFGKEFMNIMKPKAPAKNEAVALQQRANARPIPTYKVGGAVKKPMAKVQKKADGGMMQPLANAGNTAPPMTQAQAMQAAGKMTPTQPGFKSPGAMTPTRPGFTSPGQPLGGNPTFNNMNPSELKKYLNSKTPQNPGLNPVTAAVNPSEAPLRDYNPYLQKPVMAKKGGKISKNAPGLYANINAKRERIEAGSGEKMRKPGSKGAPTDMAFAKSKITKKADGGTASTNEDIRNRYRDMLAGEGRQARPDRAAKVSNRNDRRADREVDAAAKRTAREAEMAKKKTERETNEAKREAEMAKRQAEMAQRQTEAATRKAEAEARRNSGPERGGPQESPPGPATGRYGSYTGREAGPTRPGFASPGGMSPMKSGIGAMPSAPAPRAGTSSAKQTTGSPSAPAPSSSVSGNVSSGGAANNSTSGSSSPYGNRYEPYEPSNTRRNPPPGSFRRTFMKDGGKASKKMDGGPITDNEMASKLQMGQPQKYAQGGAGKVRKGMMTQSGQITPGKPRGRM